MRFLRNEHFGGINSHLVDYPTPSNISYFWSFGSLAGLCLVIQLCTGIFLAMHVCFKNYFYKVWIFYLKALYD